MSIWNTLYLVGYIVGGWRLRKKWHCPSLHNNLVRYIFTLAKRGTRVYYVIGNHDEALRNFLDFKFKFGKITITDEVLYTAADGKTYLVTHEDKFDGITKIAKWLVFVGNSAYQLLLSLNKFYNSIRALFGMRYWSLSAYLKKQTNKTLDFLYNFKRHITNYARKRGFDGVICGHLHTPEIETINGVQYVNNGDWVERCSALVEHTDGNFELIFYEQNTLLTTKDE